MRKLIAAGLLAFLFVGHNSNAQESKFKALFLNKFAQYIEWPSGEKQLTIGVLGKSKVFDELSAVAAAKGHMKVIQIYSVDEYAKCDVIYVPKYMEFFTAKLKEKIGNKSILVVSDVKEHAGSTADIGFYIEDQRLLFMIDPRGIKAKKMKASSRLINLGLTV